VATAAVGGLLIGLFAQMLWLCVAEGLAQTEVVAIDSTKVEANASANRTRRQIVDEILEKAGAADAAEDDHSWRALATLRCGWADVRHPAGWVETALPVDVLCQFPAHC